MKRFETTAIYTVVMAALLLSGFARSGMITRLAAHLPLYKQPAVNAMAQSQVEMAQARAESMSGLYTARVSQKVALAQAKCARIEAQRNARDQVRMARGMARLEAAKARLMAQHNVWISSSNHGNDDFLVYQSDDSDDNNADGADIR